MDSPIPKSLQMCLTDGSLGPAVRGCRGDFDFTLRFEHIFLSIIPSALFIAISAYGIVRLSRSPRVVGGKLFQWIKLGVITVYAALQLALLILFSTTNTRSYDTAIGAAALSVFGSTTLLALSWAEHSRSLRPSILLTFYLTLTLLLDIVQARTLLIISPSWVLGRLFTAAACLKGVILLLENYPKTSYAFHVQPSPEASMGIFSIATYAWLGRLVVLGSQKTLNISDLYDLDPNMASEDLDTQFWVAWNKPSSRGRKLRLAVALVRATKWQLLAPVPPRIARTGLNFCQPFLIQSIQTHLLKPYTPELDQQGKGLIGATVLVYLGIAMSIGIYQYYNRRAITFLRGFLVAGIYRKTVTIEALGACGT